MRHGARFLVVGVVGFVVQVAALSLLTMGAGVPHPWATGAAVELAVLHNFVWHERWTWAERAVREPRGAWRRLGRFHLTNGVVSVAGNVAVTAALVAALDLPLLVANVLAVGGCTLVNFVAADRLVFPRIQEVGT